MTDAFPKAKSARVTRSLVVKQEKATFRCLPGSERFRPSIPYPRPEPLPRRRLDRHRLALHHGRSRP